MLVLKIILYIKNGNQPGVLDGIHDPRFYNPVGWTQ
jgi:hypothetical protein